MSKTISWARGNQKTQQCPKQAAGAWLLPAAAASSVSSDCFRFLKAANTDCSKGNLSGFKCQQLKKTTRETYLLCTSWPCLTNSTMSALQQGHCKNYHKLERNFAEGFFFFLNALILVVHAEHCIFIVYLKLQLHHDSFFF